MINENEDEPCEFTDPHPDEEAASQEGTQKKVFEEKKRRAISAVPVDVIVSVGRVRPQIGELLNMRREAIIPLESKINDPVEVWVGEHMVAKGELMETEDGSGRLSVRLTDVIELNDVV